MLKVPVVNLYVSFMIFVKEGIKADGRGEMTKVMELVRGEFC